MNISDTPLPGLRFIGPRRFGDHRGFFAETWNRRAYEDQGIAIDWVQDNHSLSATPGTLRGMHFQAPPHAQAKLVRCGRGRLFDVVVDLRRGSPNYGQWEGFELSAENGRQLLISAGFAHGFVTRESRIRRSSTNAPTTTPPRPRARWPGMTRRSASTGVWMAVIRSCRTRIARPRLSDIDTPFTYEETAP